MDHGGGRRGTGRLTLIPFSTKGPFFVSFVSFVFLVSAPNTAIAQIYESIGIRAQGMSGAFVAVADDATTTWWNPGGLASGGYFNSLIEFDHIDHPAGTRASAFALNVPSLGLSYYRLALNGMRLIHPIGAPSASREDQGVLNQFGVTVGQSVGPHLIIGSTLKLVHALGDTGGDLDVGAMATFSRFRLGLAAKNLRAPEFSDGETRLELTRQVRAGASIRGGSPSRAEFTAAVDADLTTTPTAVGDERHLAAGAEALLANGAIGLRAGVGMNTLGESRTSGSVGVSVGLRRGSFLDGQLTRGADEARNGWGLALRVTF